MSAPLGRYEILRPLARGGMAEVFLARRRSAGGLEKRLVIKRVRSERASDPRLLELFVREARVSMALSHQNIVPVFDFGRAGDELYLAMEYVDGRDLAAAIARARDRGTPLPPALVAFIGTECCAALSYAHERRFDDGSVGVVHRDVTPRNILLSWAGEVRLTDFGIVALHQDEAGVVRGTPQYMAPEQARGEAVDGRADLYALALVLHEALTGVRVRSGEPEEAFAAARVGEVPPLPPEVPRDLAAVIARATAPAREDRYPDARAMQDALGEIARASRGVPARLLADWVAGLFPDRDHEPSIDPRPLAAMTFLDDGEAALLGGATARSMAATAAEAEPEVATRFDRPTRPVARERRARGPVAAIVGLALAGGAALAWNAARTPAVSPSEPRLADAGPAARPVDAGVVVAVAAADAAPAPVDAPPARPVDAAPARPHVDAGSHHVEHVHPNPAPDAAVAPAVPRAVTLGSRPWADFYVDGDSRRHQTPETVSLPPGRHRVRFVNEGAHIDHEITIEVPADHDIKHFEVLLPDSH